MNKKPLRSYLMACLLSLALLPLATVHASADLISSQEALAIERSSHTEQVQAWLQRDEAAAELVALGVDPTLAQARVAALSPQELEAIAERLDELPAGAGVIEVLGITFLVLIILDLVGVINLFGLGR